MSPGDGAHVHEQALYISHSLVKLSPFLMVRLSIVFSSSPRMGHLCKSATQAEGKGILH